MCCGTGVTLANEKVKRKQKRKYFRKIGETTYAKLVWVSSRDAVRAIGAIEHVTVPGWQSNGPIWAKCDMLATVGFERLNKPYLKGRHGRRFVELAAQ